MNIQIVANMWFDVKEDDDGDIILGTSGENGNYVEIVIKKRHKRFAKALAEALQKIL